MRNVNRFLEKAKNNPDGVERFSSIFCDAQLSEADDIVEAMYVIGDRRSASGCPVDIEEITNAIGGLASNRNILDAAIDVCMQGLTSSGYSKEQAEQALLESTASMVSRGDIEESDGISALLHESVRRINPHGIELPQDFGPLHGGGQLRYELRRLIGRGTQGCVYEACDRVFAESGIPSLVAVKIFHGSHGAGHTQEGVRARRVRHKHIARVIDQGESEGGEQYVAYELIDGLTLDLWIKHQPAGISIRQACSMVISVAQGVQSAHNAGIVHRDLKPSNVLVNREDEPIVTDFGISHAKHTYDNSARYGAHGSLAFMAPEQYDGMLDGSMPSVDIYALGGLLYWLATGRYPNGDSVGEAVKWLEERCDGGPHRDLDWGMDSRLKAIVGRALCVDPADRYQSVEVFAQDLGHYLDNRAIAWLDRSPATQAKLFIKRKPVVVLLSLLAMGLTAGVFGVWVDARAAIRHERLQAVAAAEIRGLEQQVVLEQARVEDVQEKSALLKTLVQTWSGVLDVSDIPGQTESSLLFLHTVSTNPLVQSDGALVNDLLNQKVIVGEQLLSSLKEQAGSPLQIALWHEVLAAWCTESDEVMARGHLFSALELIEKFASEDAAWRSRLLSSIESLESDIEVSGKELSKE